MTKLQNLPRVVKFNFNKHLPQSSAEKTNDLFFILSTIYMADRKEKELTKLTLEKALFKTSQTLSEKNYSFLNTFFFINTYGPHNNVFYKYLEELGRAGLIELEQRAVYLTARGLSVISDMLEQISDDEDLQKIFLALENKVRKYTNDLNLAMRETHSQKVIDTTDRNKIKTIDDLIKEIKPEKRFKKASQFKYIEPLSEKEVRKVVLPSKIINKLESILAKVEELDFEKDSDISCLFA